jgi:type II secretory pathway predicted ATPase ExeA
LRRQSITNRNQLNHIIIQTTSTESEKLSDMLEKIQSYYGFSVLPFGRNLAPGQLFSSAEHNQAVARIGYGITTCGITVITGEVGVGSHC